MHINEQVNSKSQFRTYPAIERAPPEIPAASSSGAANQEQHILASFDSKQCILEQREEALTKDGSRGVVNDSAGNHVLTTPEGLEQQQQQKTFKPRSTLRLTFILLALFLSLFIAALDATIVTTAVPVITHELNSATGYTWIGGAYLIANAVAAPIWAKFSDIWGRKPIMLAAVALFFASSAICATAKSMQVLIAGRALQGTAGGGLILLVHVVISDLFSVRQRSLFMGITEGVWASAGAIGPPLGGIFASLVSWRWCFYINLPICATSFVLLVVFMNMQHTSTSFHTGIRAIDWFGIITFLACTLMVLLGLDFGGDVFPWTSGKVIALLVVGACMLAAFIYSEARLARYPLIPLALFRDKSNLAAMSVGAFHGLAFIPGEYYVPLYLQGVKQRTPIASGVLLIPLVLATALIGVLTGVLIHKTGRFRELTWLGTVLLCLGNGLFIQLSPSTPIPTFIGLTIIFGCGSGMLFEPPLIAIQSRTPQTEVATATSTFSFIRSVALSISVILGGVVFQNGMDARSSRLTAAGLPADIVEALSGREAAANVALAGTLTDSAARRVVESAFAWALRNMWIMYTVLAGLGVVASAFVGEAKLSRDHVETVTGIGSGSGSEGKEKNGLGNDAGSEGVELR